MHKKTQTSEEVWGLTGISARNVLVLSEMSQIMSTYFLRFSKIYQLVTKFQTESHFIYIIFPGPLLRAGVFES